MPIKRWKKSTYGQLLTYVRPYWGAFALGVIGSIFFSGLDAYVTHFMKPLLDEGFVNRNMAFLARLPFIIVGLFLLRAGASFVASYFMTSVGRDVVKALREKLFNHLLKLPAGFYDMTTSGQLLSKIIYNTDQVANACTNAVSTAVQSIALIIGLFIVMFSISWRLTLFYIIIAPLVAIIVRYTSVRMRRLSRNVQNYLGDMTHVAEETIEGYKVVKIFGGQAYESEKFSELCKRNRDQAMKVIVTDSFSTLFVFFIGGLVFAGTVYLVTMTSVHAFGLTAGGFAAMIAAMLSILKPMRDYTSVNNIIQQGLAGAQSIFEVLAEPAEKDEGTKILPIVKGRVEYRQVSFRYRENTPLALKDLSFIIEPGQMVALVGRSGGGKTTLASLLPRFYDATEGCILVDDINTHEMTLESLRKHISIVTQQVTLFNDTIANNIAYGSFEKATEHDIIKAAQMAHAMEFIEKLPEGMQTTVGENGVLLSGGQRQRIAIARALLKNAPILILDEATSALDTESERKIQAAFEELMKGRTTLVIAHRLSTIEHADKIIVIDEGRVIETGTHADLLAKRGTYADLYRLQFKPTGENL
jgi:subfamily B ATP-binding cassette protein MsbA